MCSLIHATLAPPHPCPPHMHACPTACPHHSITPHHTSLMQSACMLPRPPTHRPSSCMPMPSPSCPHAAHMACPTPSSTSAPPPSHSRRTPAGMPHHLPHAPHA